MSKEGGRVDTRASLLKGKEGQSVAAERARLKGRVRKTASLKGKKFAEKTLEKRAVITFFIFFRKAY